VTLARNTTTEIDFTGPGKLIVGKVLHQGGALRVIAKPGQVTSTFTFH
jgi:hypothetical protein